MNLGWQYDSGMFRVPEDSPLRHTGSEKFVAERLQTEHDLQVDYLDRNVSFSALPPSEVNNAIPGDVAHSSMFHNAWDVQRLVAMIYLRDHPEKAIGCHGCTNGVDLGANKRRFCHYNKPGDRPPQYPKAGRLQHWAVPCRMDERTKGG